MNIIQSAASLACSDNGSYIVQAVAYIGGTVGVASVVANFRNKLPPVVVQVADALALNFVKAAVAKTAEPPKA